MRDQNWPLPMSNMLIGVKTSNISPWGIKIRHPHLYLHGHLKSDAEQRQGCSEYVLNGRFDIHESGTITRVYGKKKVTHLRWFSVLSVPALKSNSICLCSAWVRKTEKICHSPSHSAMVKKIHDTRITSLHTVICLKNMPYPMMCFPEGSHWHQTSSAWSHCVLLNISKCHCQRSALVIPLWHNSNSACEGLRRVSHWMVDQLPSRYAISSSTWNRQKSRCCKRIQGQWVNHYIYIYIYIYYQSIWFPYGFAIASLDFPKIKLNLAERAAGIYISISSWTLTLKNFPAGLNTFRQMLKQPEGRTLLVVICINY